MTLKIKLKAQLGVKPRATIASLERCARNGTVDTLVIGGSKYGWGSAKWIVKSVTDKWERFIGGGLMEAGCTVEFKEYAESSKAVTVIKKPSPAPEEDDGGQDGRSIEAVLQCGRHRSESYPRRVRKRAGAFQ